jgi:rubrerythrin
VARAGDAVPDEARARLLEAWRGEIEAGAVYELIAQREKDPKRAEILRKMAAAEGGHRQRLEARMRELGIPVPDPGSVHISLWTNLQTKVAPLDRLLAAREAAESDEVDDLYLRPTGDEEPIASSGDTGSALGQLRIRARTRAGPSRRP